MKSTLTLTKSATGFRWKWRDKNGHKLANGGQGYSRKADMMRVLRRLFWFIGDGRVQAGGIEDVELVDLTDRNRQ